MISTFHPSTILCTPEKWTDEVFQDEFLNNLLLHIEKIKELRLNIAWCDEILYILWKEPPWKDNFTIEEKLIEIYYEIINCNCIFSAPPENECQIVPDLKVDFSDEVNTCWLVLIHRLMHKQDKVLIATGLDIETKSIHVSCSCDSKNSNNTYEIISDPSQWYKRINYMRLCPKNLENWDEDFLLTLKLCYEQEFSQRSLKTKIEKLLFSNKFKKTFKDISDEGKKQKIISTIVQRLTYTKAEAGRHSGLRDEQIKGKQNEYSFRVSDVERIHYTIKIDKMLLLDYYSGSEHDIRCK